jgi:hypothetical protein
MLGTPHDTVGDREPAGAVGMRAGITLAEAGNAASATTIEHYGAVLGVMRTSGDAGQGTVRRC